MKNQKYLVTDLLGRDANPHLTDFQPFDSGQQNVPNLLGQQHGTKGVAFITARRFLTAAKDNFLVRFTGRAAVQRNQVGGCFGLRRRRDDSDKFKIVFPRFLCSYLTT